MSYYLNKKKYFHLIYLEKHPMNAYIYFAYVIFHMFYYSRLSSQY